MAGWTLFCIFCDKFRYAFNAKQEYSLIKSAAKIMYLKYYKHPIYILFALHQVRLIVDEGQKQHLWRPIHLKGFAA